MNRSNYTVPELTLDQHQSLLDALEIAIEHCKRGIEENLEYDDLDPQPTIDELIENPDLLPEDVYEINELLGQIREFTKLHDLLSHLKKHCAQCGKEVDTLCGLTSSLLVCESCAEDEGE